MSTVSRTGSSVSEIASTAERQRGLAASVSTLIDELTRS